MQHFSLHRGHLPLLISVPHHGMAFPDEVAAQLLPEALRSPDSDHHVAQLYDQARALGASLLIPRWSRYVIDLNRGPDARPLYPGQQETTLVPTHSFAGAALYAAGAEPDGAEIQRRLARYWRPYHHALLDELVRLRARHPQVLLWDGHSIPGECPMFFSGLLPDFNVGTADGHSCDAAISSAIAQHLARQSRFTHVVNGRFKGGFITRNYGRPGAGIHAVQLELAQRAYMDERDPASFAPERAAPCATLATELLQLALSQLARR